mmetsp:Transcript_21942/g.66681  ORF Transcript_21942/g.66681 Transcript_21942/m.66681 type:complete len:167 (-) Transcript_21942:724-1224(-)
MESEIWSASSTAWTKSIALHRLSLATKKPCARPNMIAARLSQGTRLAQMTMAADTVTFGETEKRNWVDCRGAARIEVQAHARHSSMHVLLFCRVLGTVAVLAWIRIIPVKQPEHARVSVPLSEKFARAPAQAQYGIGVRARGLSEFLQTMQQESNKLLDSRFRGQV